MTTPATDHLVALGSKVLEGDLETFEAPAHVTVTFTTREFTSICPVTGQPDFSEVTIEYIARSACIESKSLKLYLRKFRDVGAFVETLAVTIANDVKAATDAYEVNVTVDQGIRGGIRTVAFYST